MGKAPAIGRRAFGTLAAAALLPAYGCAAPAERLAKIEETLGGRVGLAALNTGTGERIAYRADERFALCSTYKWMLAGLVLADVERNRLTLDQPIAFGEKDLVDHAPVVRAHIAQGALPVRTLCEAMMEVSDNAAANLLMNQFGGPRAIARAAHSVGDHTTRLDRLEPDLNSNIPGDPRDTTMPEAMLGTMQKVLLGDDALTPPSREILIGWLKSSKTGLDRLRAGLPPKWSVGDKTGTGQNGAANNVAIAWPPNGPPILIAAYLSGSREPAEVLNAAHADIARIVVSALT